MDKIKGNKMDKETDSDVKNGFWKTISKSEGGTGLSI